MYGAAALWHYLEVVSQSVDLRLLHATAVVESSIRIFRLYIVCEGLWTSKLKGEMVSRYGRQWNRSRIKMVANLPSATTNPTGLIPSGGM